MAGIALAVHVPAMMAAAVAVETAKLVQLKTVLAMVIAVRRAGLVMDLLTVKIRPMAVISPAMIMMVVTVKVAVEPQVVAVKIVMTVNMILHHMDPNAVIQPGMNMVLIVLRWKVVTTGIVQAVAALVIRPGNVVTVPVTIMKIVKAVPLTVVNVVIVRMAI